MSTESDKNFRLEQACASDDSIQQVHAALQKTKPEKIGGYPLLPLGILGLMCTAVFFGSIYLAHNSIRFDPLVFNEHANREKPGAMLGADTVILPALFPAICAGAPHTSSTASASRSGRLPSRRAPIPLWNRIAVPSTST